MTGTRVDEARAEMSKLTPVRRDMVYQIGTIRSLLTGVYEGDLRFGELAHYGDFGLGTFDAVNGEMVALDGHFYRIDAEGRAHPVDPQRKTPFAVVTHFGGAEKQSIGALEGLPVLQRIVSAGFESQNIIYAIRLEGDFVRVDARSEHPQPEGHRPLSTTIAQVQTTFAFENLQGTLVGFWFPEHMKAINVPGFHFHFLDAGHALGGHVFDLQLRRGTLQVMPIFDFGMHLLHTPLFEQVDLSREAAAATRAVEKAPNRGREP
jgi:acetolactate decarboxylase